MTIAIFCLYFLTIAIIIMWNQPETRRVFVNEGRGVRLERSGITNGNVISFRKYDSFSDKEDAKRLTNGANDSGFHKVLLENAKKQAELNNSQPVKEMLRKQKWTERKIALKKTIKKFSRVDILIFSVFVILPFIILAIMEIPYVHDKCMFLFVKVFNHRADLFLAQLSLTFITISVMSIFSDGNAIIYWQNIVKQTLIEPPASCFKAYFGYSFFYLLASFIALACSYDAAIGVFFVFNIVCLFDLSRKMINCYYNPNAKKKKLEKDFIKKIEWANAACFEINKKDIDKTIKDQEIEDVRATFEELNYYTNDAFSDKKHNLVRENLAVYGKLLAHVHPALMEPAEFPIMGWYDGKTYKYYKDVVKNYYAEALYMQLGYIYSNATPLECSIEREIINPIFVNLANDAPNIREVEWCRNIAVYRFLIKMLSVARIADYENFSNYTIPADEILNESYLQKNKADISKQLSYLAKWSQNTSLQVSTFPNPESLLTNKEFSKLVEHWVKGNEFMDALAELVGSMVLINNGGITDISFDWIPWQDLGKQKSEVMKKAKSFVVKNSAMFSEKRKNHCMRQLQNVDWAIPEYEIQPLDKDNAVIAEICKDNMYEKESLEENTYIKYWGLFIGEKVVGILGLAQNEKEGSIAQVKIFMMHKDYQRQGIGTKFFEDVIESLMESEYTAIRVAVEEKGSKFWTNLGFEKQEPFDGEDVIFKLLLGN